MLRKPADVLQIKADLQHLSLDVLRISRILLQVKAEMLQVRSSGSPALLREDQTESRVLQIILDLLQILLRRKPAIVVLLQVDLPLQLAGEVLLHIHRVRRLAVLLKRARSVRRQSRTADLQQNDRFLLPNFRVGEARRR
ncbi:MAG TPA: hypothetical protein VLQ45_25500 [Thermoanaerobaculia bacterium]|nr:hypothetical protein [Thermoanaerobaculia bacterium]